MSVVGASFARLASGPVQAAQHLRRLGASRWPRLPAEAVSVGNLAFGGRGKTPLVATLCRSALAEGRHPAILIRGYGGAVERRGAAPVVLCCDEDQGPTWLRAVRSDGEERPAWAWARDVGDEAAWLAAACPGVPVGAHPRRGRAADEIVARRPEVDLLLLDDGFQAPVRRDVDIVLIDPSVDLAAGRASLREGPAALTRATLVVDLCGGPTDAQGPTGVSGVSRRLRADSARADPLRVRREPTRFTDLAGRQVPADGVPPLSLGAGVGDPASVRRLATELRVDVRAHPGLRDHRPPGALFHAARRLTGDSRPLLITEKDAVGWAAAAPPPAGAFVLGMRMAGAEEVWRRVALLLSDAAGTP